MSNDTIKLIKLEVKQANKKKVIGQMTKAKNLFF
jgi:hypothetical protein